MRDPQDRPKFIDHPIKALLGLISVEVLRDSEDNVNVIRATDLDWTIARFPMLTDGPHTGQYRAGYLGKDSGARLSRADGAAFVVKELAEAKWIRRAPVVSQK